MRTYDALFDDSMSLDAPLSLDFNALKDTDSLDGSNRSASSINSPSSPRNVRIPPRSHHLDQHLNNQHHRAAQLTYDTQSSATPSGSSSALQSLTSASTLSTLESSGFIGETGTIAGVSHKLDLTSQRESVARKGLLRESVFDHWKDDTAGMEPEPVEEMQKKDPLGTQIWKLYHKTRGQLPNSERLENLTWRMMSMNLRKREMQRREYVDRASLYWMWILTLARLERTAGSNQPSGIAQQLRQASIAKSKQEHDDHMNLDDFIVPTSVGTPAGISPAPSGLDIDLSSMAGPASTLPINRRQQQIQAEELSLARASAPSQSALQQKVSGEFDYVPRHVRKTSIDERRVSPASTNLKATD